MQKIKILDGKLELNPGGIYDMKNGNWVEFKVAKLHLLIANIEKMIDVMCDCAEIQENRTPYSSELMVLAEKLYDNHYKDIVENYSPYKVEFRHEITIPEFLKSAPWKDTSWHNDSCPSFINQERRIKVWVEEDNPESREMTHAKFYVVGGHFLSEDLTDIDWNVELYETESEEDLVRFLEEVKSDWS